MRRDAKPSFHYDSMQDKCQILTTFGIFSYRGNLKKLCGYLQELKARLNQRFQI
jgi:hypothetical protein